MKIKILHKDKAAAKEYMSHSDCILATALKRKLPESKIKVYGHDVLIDGKQFHIAGNPSRVHDMGYPECLDILSKRAFKPFVVELIPA